MPMPQNMPTNLAAAPKDKYIEKLAAYTKGQLLELKGRQLKLIANKWVFFLLLPVSKPYHIFTKSTNPIISRSFLHKLPDKGARIQSLYDKICIEIKARDEVECAAMLFSELNIVEKGEKMLTHMEWCGGKVDCDQIIVAADTMNSDDEIDSVDPLKIIAQSRNTKLVKIQKPAQSLITEADLADIKALSKAVNSTSDSSANTSTNTAASMELDPRAINIMKNEECKQHTVQQKQTFLPFRTTKSDVHNVDREKARGVSKNWTNSSATPPLIRNDAAKLISLQESIDTERLQKEKYRDEMEKHAAERLATRRQIISENINLLPGGSEMRDPNSFFQSYQQREDKFMEDQEDEDSLSEHSALDDEEDDEQDTHGVSVAIDN